jgi:hypothetical protein
MDARFGHDVHVPPQKIFEVLLEPNQVEERSVAFHLDQQIDVAVGPVLAACDGTDDAHVPRAVPGGNAQDLVTVLVNRHGQLSQAL